VLLGEADHIFRLIDAQHGPVRDATDNLSGQLAIPTTDIENPLVSGKGYFVEEFQAPFLLLRGIFMVILGIPFIHDVHDSRIVEKSQARADMIAFNEILYVKYEFFLSRSSRMPGSLHTIYGFNIFLIFSHSMLYIRPTRL
jgi:hypothetical protein